MPILTVTDYSSTAQGWAPGVDATAASGRIAEHLEEGGIALFDDIPFPLPASDIAFLLTQRQGSSRFHKNISYRPQADLLKGLEPGADHERMRAVMAAYSQHVTRFVTTLLGIYAGSMRVDFASFRPIEEAGRQLPLHRRNDLLHVDSFPTRPAHGWRILRAFTNIDPLRPRVWNIGEPFHQLAPRLAEASGLREVVTACHRPLARLGRSAKRCLAALGIPALLPSPYDRFMLHFHDRLKENRDYQEQGIRARVVFPPRATWLVYTDSVPHAALSGQFALEHTYMVDPAVMRLPQTTPIHVLERLLPGVSLVS